MRKDRGERFIQSQLEGLARLGLGPEALKREEALLRAGLDRDHILSALFQRLHRASSDAIGHKNQAATSEAAGPTKRASSSEAIGQTKGAA